MKAALGVGEGEKNWIVSGEAALGVVKGVNPEVEFLTALARWKRRVIGDIVAAAHECIDCTKRLPLAFGQNQKPVIEIFCA
jgi:hypothetical protein